MHMSPGSYLTKSNLQDKNKNSTTTNESDSSNEMAINLL